MITLTLTPLVLAVLSLSVAAVNALLEDAGDHCVTDVADAGRATNRVLDGTGLNLAENFGVPEDEWITRITLIKASISLWQGRRACSVCKRTAAIAKVSTLSACARCGSVVYCSVECQRTDWKAQHKSICHTRVISMMFDPKNKHVKLRLVKPST